MVARPDGDINSNFSQSEYDSFVVPHCPHCDMLNSYMKELDTNRSAHGEPDYVTFKVPQLYNTSGLPARVGLNINPDAISNVDQRAIMKPDLVFFGGSIAADDTRRADHLVAKCDAMIVLGTSLTVLIVGAFRC